MKKGFKILKVVIPMILVIACLFPTWTPPIEGKNSISVLEQMSINGTEHEVMIRGNDKSNPVIIYVHGGPCCSEIPYVRRYQQELEAYFTIVHYDQRGSGKSYHFFEDYSNLSIDLLTSDLLQLTDKILEVLDKEKVILIGHSFGTNIALRAAARAPEKYESYIGIGQVSNKLESEKDNWSFCKVEAKKAQEVKDIMYLDKIRDKVEQGEMITPRSIIRKYGGSARLINETEDYVKGFLLGSEYNLLDIGRYYLGIVLHEKGLSKESYEKSLTDHVLKVDLPLYFIMGKYDHTTSTAIAKNYFDEISSSVNKEFIIYEESAHYPQFEEKEKFTKWMVETFRA